MDKYVTVRKPITRVDKSKARQQTAAPYPPRNKLDEDRHRREKLSAPLYADGRKPSPSTITKHLLNTLKDDSNPITHSNIYERSDTVVSAATGHQRGEGRTPFGDSSKSWFDDRSRKLALQRKEEKHTGGVLNNIRIYIDGYLNGMTDIEMKRIIAQAGGTTLLIPSGATHILTSQHLSGSKTHQILTTKSKNPVHVVRPEWVTDSIKAGRRLRESRYAIISPSSTRNLVDMLKAGRPS